ncbi:hypothetical protein NON20_02445 [Synechocystis sp. B12]|nr:hypothetical protein NON20_02445 [Synechocystis sp. B12]
MALYPVDGEQVNDLIGHIRENLQQLLPQPTNPGSGEADDHIETAVDVRIGAPSRCQDFLTLIKSVWRS